MEKTLTAKEVDRRFPFWECQGCEYMDRDEAGKADCFCLSLEDAPAHCPYLK